MGDRIARKRLFSRIVVLSVVIELRSIRFGEQQVAQEETSSGLPTIPGPELVVGLVGPVGANLDVVTASLRLQLSRVGYQTFDIRVSRLISNVSALKSLQGKAFPSDFERIDQLMDAGSAIRRATRRGDALALLTIAEIQRRRTEENRKTHGDWSAEKCAKTPLPRTAYVLRSLKNPAEIQTLRDVYGRAFSHMRPDRVG